MTDRDFLTTYLNSFYLQFDNDIAGIKDNQSRYLLVTQKYAKLLGFNNASELIGLSDGDANTSIASYEKIFYQQDRLVEQTRESLICMDNHYYGHGFDSYLFNKTPVINPRTKNVLGVRLVATKPLLLLPVRLALEMQQASVAKYPLSPEIGSEQKLDVKLTERQHLVLFLVMNGYSQGDIVKTFRLLKEQISEAAVKDVMRVLKIKFDVKNKEELIKKAIRNGLHTHVPAKLILQGSFILRDFEFKIK
jgi:DNA-binding CsgD family transcriptional regulator